MKKTVIELFAGVGGFRVGLNNIKLVDDKVIEENNFSFVWANQWEPSTKAQHAYDCYVTRFGKSENHSNIDISLVDKKKIPNHTLLCGGFPCQDYSVAHSLSKEKGIEGKKGVLWWQIRDILKAKKTPFVFLENVDRLLKSPSKQRGRDFGIMLRCLADLGYYVEWRVINAADYGMPQRRRRIYIIAYRKNTFFAKMIKKNKIDDIIKLKGVFGQAFQIELFENKYKQIDIINEYNDLVEVSNNFNFEFENAGIMINGIIYTTKVTPKYVSAITLKEIIEKHVSSKYFLSKDTKEKFKVLRGSKRIPRTAPDGSTYFYSEGSMSETDSLDLPGRTMLTSEGTTNRSTHIIRHPGNNRIRLLTPVECERLNQFPDNWTDTGMPEKRRYFMMGNALVCGIINKIGIVLSKIIDEEK